MIDGIDERLLRRTLELVDLPSESRSEAAILDRLSELMPEGAFELADAGDATRFFLPAARRPAVPLVVFAGHVDTVPAHGNIPGRREADTVIGRGASDMKGALAVMVELAQGVAADGSGDLDVGLLFFGREELPMTESALLPFFERCPAVRDIALAIVMEPTANRIEIGCMGNLNARVEVLGRTAHSARPWLGDNAIHAAIASLSTVADRPVRDVEIDGLVYREVVSVTTIGGGLATNVIPDRVEAAVNLRYAPNRTREDAEAELRELLDERASIEIVSNAPPGPVTAGNALVDRLRASGDLEIGPKQAWTPVAEFAMAGVDAVNFGPGDPRYAHRDDERVEADALRRSFEVLRAFLAAGKGR